MSTFFVKFALQLSPAAGLLLLDNAALLLGSFTTASCSSAAASPIADAASQHSPARFAPDWQRKSSSLDHADAIHVLAVFVLAQAAHCLRVSAGFRRVAAAYGDASALLKKPKMLIPALPFAPFLMSLQTKMCSFSRSVQRYPCPSVPHSALSCPHFSRF